ncbi:MAG: carbohydrate porin [Gluconacetobacter diazotrophicus]|nr:carbohydrate porin [Gluconacetobacter diazotrophicus]
MSPARILGCAGVALWLFACTGLRADPQAAAEAPKGFFERDSPLPDPGGERAKLADRGIALGLIYTGEVFGNPAGGYRQGAVYNGLLTAGLDIDFGKLLGWNGLKFHGLTYESHGPNGTNLYTRDLNFYSSINAYDSFRLSELWLQASLLKNVVNLRVGQEEVDAEFATTIGGALFLHSNFGALPTLTLNVPTPTYPEADPAARLRLNTLHGHFYFQAGVYAGNANADRDGDPNPGFRAGNAYNDDGVRFPISGNQGLLSVYEAGYLRNYRKDDPGLPGAYRVGGFYHTGDFSDAFLNAADPFLTLPPVDARPRVHHGDGGFYAVAEQVLYRPRNPRGGNEDVATSAAAPIGNAEDSPLGLNGVPAPAGSELRVFGRLGIGQGDRSLTDFYVEAGLNYRAPLPGRDQDVFGVGFTYTSLSDDARRLVRDADLLNGERLPSPDYEGISEATYQANLAPWLSVQPDLQYIVHPGGSPRYGNALVVGVRTVVTF